MHTMSQRRPALVGLAATALALALALAAGAAPGESVTAGVIAFARSDGIYVMHSDGSGIRLLRNLPSSSSGIAWSPDGSRLAFTTPAHGNLLWVMDANGANITRIVLHTGEAMSPTWSPDGRRIAFTGWLDRGRDIWVMNADGGGQHRLARTHGYQEATIDWSPNGNQIAFSGLLYQGIHLITLSGSIVQHLPAQMSGYYAWEGEPAWAPDGHRVVFMQKTTDNTKAWPGPTSISIMNLSDGSRIQLTQSGAADTEPAWSPDGKRIVFVRTAPRNGSSADLYVMNADRSGLKQLTDTAHTAEWSPAWQPATTS